MKIITRLLCKVYFISYICIRKREYNTHKMKNTIVTISSKDARRAMVIASRTANAFVAGVQMARVSELKQRMMKEVVGFSFLKADNKTVTHRFGTTMSALAKSHINGRGVSGDARNVVVFWDTEKGAWRSFRIEKLISID